MRRPIALASAGLAGLVLAVLLAAQLLLPGIAAQRLRDRLARSGKVLEVRVEAFPAIELLWHQADRVVIRIDRYQSNPGHLSSLLSQSREVGSIDASARELDAGLLKLHDAVLRKRGDQLTGSGRTTEADLRAAAPFLDSVRPIASGGGQLILEGTATLLGVTATVDATVSAQDGQVILQPNVPFGALATLTVFSNPHLYVESVGASPAPDGFNVSARARLR